ncbi:MAG: Hsp20/alpha crystallin family protein [Pirellulaceae bacterium]|nr:Hsp20/alpha crystallin family protein [Pirellulaceae bacterium]
MRMIFPNPMSGQFLDDLATEMNSFVENIFGDENKAPAGGFVPRMDVVETNSGYKLCLDLPGVNPDDVQIEMENDHVVIHGDRVRNDAADDETHRRVERAFGQFRRIVRLPKLIDKDAITADYDNGVLTIVMPKKVEASTSRRIKVSHGSSGQNADKTNA